MEPSLRTFQASFGPSGQSRQAETNKHTYLCHGRCSRRHNEIFPAYSGTGEEVRHSKTEVQQVLCGKTECDLRRRESNLTRLQEGEMVNSFITALYCLAEHCQYGTLHDEMIRDRIVVRLKNMKLSEKLQNDPDLTLQKAIQQTHQSEAVKKQQSLIRSKLRGNDPAKTVDAVHSRGRKTSPRSKFNTNSSGKPKPQLQERKPPASRSSTHDKCQRCGKIPHHNRQNCPAQDAVC